MKPEKQELAINDCCPCESGKNYGRCCKKKDFKWVKDSAGKIFRQVPIHPILGQFLKGERERFKSVFGREPTANDPLLFDMLSPKEVEEAMVEALVESGVSPGLVYAYLKTGLLVTEFNKNLLPEKDIEEWNAAYREFESLVKEKHPVPKDDWSTKVEDLFAEIEPCKIFFRQIVRKHGVAINVKYKRKQNAPLHDFVFFCFTKSLTSFEAIDRLLETKHGEDALIVIRSIYESYLTINFLISHPDQINSFVAA